DDLPGMHDDPLKAVREENAKAGFIKPAEKSSEKPKAREVQVAAIAFSRDGANAAVQLHANDNKDRWIVSVDFKKKTLAPQHRLHDDAWVNWAFNEFGWENDNRTLWYVSEETGYAHLYAKPPGGKSQALTRGEFEIARPVLSADGRWFYVRSNAEAP